MLIATYIFMKGENVMNNSVKRFVSLVLSLAVAVSVCVSTSASESKPPVEIKAKAAVLMDASTGKILMKFNETKDFVLHL